MTGNAASLSERLIQAAVDYESGRCSQRELSEARAAVEAAIIPAPAQAAPDKDRLFDQIYKVAQSWDHARGFEGHPDGLRGMCGDLLERVVLPALAAHAPSTPHPDDCDCIGAVIGQHERSCRFASQPPAAPVVSDTELQALRESSVQAAKTCNSYLERALNAEADALRLHKEKMEMYERAIAAETKLAAHNGCSAATAKEILNREDDRPLPTYGQIPWKQIGRDVIDVIYAKREDYEFDPTYYEGHQTVPRINFNSLARIVDKYRWHGLLNDLPQQSAEAQAKIERLEKTIDLLEANAKVQAKLLADTGRERDQLRDVPQRASDTERDHG